VNRLYYRIKINIMQISKENKAAIVISISILFLAFFVSEIFHIFHLNYYISFSWQWQNKYIIFVILAFLTYFISYFLILQNTKAMMEANEKLKSYNHNLAHELKTPLSVIKSNLELLSLEYDEDLVKSSQEEIENMKNITDSLLFLSENRSLTDIENLSFSSLLEKYDKNDLNIILKNDFAIYWNKTMFESLVRNLLDNARKYRKKDTKIDIIIDKKTFIISNKLETKIDIKDSTKLFDAFYKLDNSRNTSWYWLGLSIVKKIADLHKLKLEIEIKDEDFILIIEK